MYQQVGRMIETVKKSGVSDVFYFMVVIILTVLFIGPVLWMMMASIKTQADAITLPPLIAFKPTLGSLPKNFSRRAILAVLAQ